MQDILLMTVLAPFFELLLYVRCCTKYEQGGQVGKAQPSPWGNQPDKFWSIVSFNQSRSADSFGAEGKVWPG